MLAKAPAASDPARQAREELTPPPFPDELRAVWGIYRALDRRRPVISMGATPLNERALLDYQAVAGVTLNAWEAHVLFTLDAALLKASDDRSLAARKGGDLGAGQDQGRD